MRGVFLKDLELRRVTINSHIFRVIDVLLVNKSYCALGHTWYHHWWWGNCDDELLAQAYGQGRPAAGAHSQSAWKKTQKSEFIWRTDMFLPNVQNVTFWARYQMWFFRKLLKNASQIVKIWQFLWNPHLVVPKPATSGFLAFLSNFWQNYICSWPTFREPDASDFDATRCGFSQKSPNLDNLSSFFGVFEQFLAKPHLVAHLKHLTHSFLHNFSLF